MQTILKHLLPTRQLPDNSLHEKASTAKVIAIESFANIKAPNCRQEKLVTFITQSMDVERIYLLGTFSCFPEVDDEEYYLLILISEQEYRSIVQLEAIVNKPNQDMAPVFAFIIRISHADEMIAAGNKFFINACTADKLIYEKRDEPTPAAA